jgi:hypothetical protein
MKDGLFRGTKRCCYAYKHGYPAVRETAELLPVLWATGTLIAHLPANLPLQPVPLEPGSGSGFYFFRELQKENIHEITDCILFDVRPYL